MSTDDSAKAAMVEALRTHAKLVNKTLADLDTPGRKNPEGDLDVFPDKKEYIETAAKISGTVRIAPLDGSQAVEESYVAALLNLAGKNVVETGQGGVTPTYEFTIGGKISMNAESDEFVIQATPGTLKKIAGKFDALGISHEDERSRGLVRIKVKSSAIGETLSDLLEDGPMPSLVERALEKRVAEVKNRDSLDTITAATGAIATTHQQFQRAVSALGGGKHAARVGASIRTVAGDWLDPL